MTDTTTADREQRDQDATILARVHEVLTRTGTTEGKFVALLGITADKMRASLAGDRRWSTYELAVIATHGKTTVEWLRGDDDPIPPETVAGLTRLRDRPDAFGPKPTPTPERDGYTIGVYLPPGVTEAVRDALFDRIADAAHTADWHQPWDAHVVGLPGDPLGAVDGEARP